MFNNIFGGSKTKVGSKHCIFFCENLSPNFATKFRQAWAIFFTQAHVRRTKCLPQSGLAQAHDKKSGAQYLCSPLPIRTLFQKVGIGKCSPLGLSTCTYGQPLVGSVITQTHLKCNGHDKTQSFVKWKPIICINFLGREHHR